MLYNLWSIVYSDTTSIQMRRSTWFPFFSLGINMRHHFIVLCLLGTVVSSQISVGTAKCRLTDDVSYTARSSTKSSRSQRLDGNVSAVYGIVLALLYHIPQL